MKYVCSGKDQQNEFFFVNNCFRRSPDILVDTSVRRHRLCINYLAANECHLAWHETATYIERSELDKRVHFIHVHEILDYDRFEFGMLKIQSQDVQEPNRLF